MPLSVWHLHDWHWHELNPGQNSRGRKFDGLLRRASLARVATVEVGSTIDAEQRSLTIDHKGARVVSQRGLDDEGKAVAPVVPVAGEQPHPLAFTLNN